MNLRQLSYFVAIAEEGQITAAARRIGISQPPLSHELSALEAELGARLVTRGARGVELTDAGRLLYQRATQLLAMASATEAEVAAFGRGYAGVLSIGLISTSGDLVPPPSLAAFADDHPDVRFEVHEGNTFEVIAMLEKGVVDVGVVRTPFPEKGLACSLARPEPMAAVVPERLAGVVASDPLPLGALDGVPVIAYRRFEQMLGEEFARAGAEIRVVCLNDDARTTCNWARRGYGVGLVPLSISRTLDTGGVRVVPIASERLQTRLALVRPEGREPSPLARRFVEAFEAEQL